MLMIEAMMSVPGDRTHCVSSQLITRLTNSAIPCRIHQRYTRFRHDPKSHFRCNRRQTTSRCDREKLTRIFRILLNRRETSSLLIQGAGSGFR